MGGPAAKQSFAAVGLLRYKIAASHNFSVQPRFACPNRLRGRNPYREKNYCSRQQHILSFSHLQFSTKESLSEETFSEEEEQAQEHAEQEEFFIAEHKQQLAGTPDFLACFRFFIIKQTTNAAQTIIKESKTIFKIMQTSNQSADFTF